MNPSTAARGARPSRQAALRGGDHLARVEQLEVQGHRDPGVEQPRLADPDRVLVPAEQGQPVLDEVRQGRACLLRGDRPAELVQGARVPGEPGAHEIEDLGRHLVRGEQDRLGEHAGAGGGERGPVLGVVVPASAGRLLAVHEHPVPAAHHPVEVLHPQLLAPRGERGELLDAAQVVPVGADLQRNPEAPCRVPQRQAAPGARPAAP